MQLAGEEIVDAKYNIADLVDLACEREIHLGLDLNSQWRGMLWMTDQHQSSSFLKPMSMSNYYRFCSGAPFRVSVIDMMNMQSFMDKSKKMSFPALTNLIRRQ